MSSESTPPVSDKARLLFGAGFAFGVMFAMFVLAVVASAVTTGGREVLATDIYITIGGGVLFTGIVGITLYVLAFPENRVELPVEELVGPRDGDE